MNPRSSFDKALIEIQEDIFQLANLVGQAIYNAVQSLIKLDPAGAAQVIMCDEEIDDLYAKIESKCIKIIATQQPIARDLRMVVTGIKILLSLERIGDHAVDIAQATMCIRESELNRKSSEYLTKMSRIVQQMIKDSLEAYSERDVQKAQEMCTLDDEVDHIFTKIFQLLIDNILTDPKSIVQSSYLLYVSRYLERIADHATDIGEAVIYLITGERKKLN